MSEHEMNAWTEALNLVPIPWIADFTQLVEEGDASREFLDFFEQDADCQRAFVIVFRADPMLAALAKVSSEEGREADAEVATAP